MLYREDDREILTNEDIKADLKKDLISDLSHGTFAVLAIALISFCCVQILRLSSESPLLFGLFAILLFTYVLSGIWLVVSGIKQAVTYIHALCRNRFYVTTDKLIDKKEGRSSLAYRLLFFLGVGILSLFYLPKPNCYEFAGGTYKVAVEKPHYRHSKTVAMNGTTLFRRSHGDDAFLLVSLKPGKPVKIYPLDLFDYRDSSPL